ncbi:hypothetical protein EC973_003249 [Apophysomyces ossiformis]|uniref:OPT family small oligopeptide transporter n=1 Tax=Apophysomyces ossiformis TaxID=679940 RepID=A0A8H7C0V7_9FUNG|nr:hypothetical protein EC973_003249 [Apophysomyces ossiformis]
MAEKNPETEVVEEKKEYAYDTPPPGEKGVNDLSYELDDLEEKFGQEGDEDVYIEIANQLASTDDDPTLRSFTVRSFFIGTVLSILSSCVYQLMSFKPVAVSLSNIFMIIIAYLFCNLWYRVLPKGGWLNHGPFNLKEHTCVYIMVSSANTSAYGTLILGAQQLFYKNSPGPAGGIFLLFATQLVGYGIAGQLRPFLVYPSHIIWPSALPTVSMLKTFNTDNDDARWRTKFFFMVFGAIFVYEFIPQYMFTVLGGVSIFCLAKRDSKLFMNLFGGTDPNEGLGILNLSFDWNFLSSISPLVLPLYVQMNYYVGILLFWIIAPLVYYNNVWEAQKFPFLSNKLFHVNKTTGKTTVYPQHLVLNEDNSLNRTKYDEVGPAYFSTINGISYVILNMAITATITHVGLYYGKDIWRVFRKQFMRAKDSEPEKQDIHMRLMAAYKEVPAWWYYAVYVVGIALNIGIAYANHSELPWWGVIFAIAMSSILSLPLNYITAITGTGFGLNVVAEMICGFVLPGYPVANMYFKTLGYNTLSQACNMAADLKIGHYLKVPPRMVFFNQFYGTIIGAIFNYIINHMVIENKIDIFLSPAGANNFWSGISLQTINTAAITWGAIGPLTMFGPGTMYSIILWAFIIGFFLPVPGYLLHKKFPKAGFDKINIIVLLTGLYGTIGSSSCYLTVSLGIVLVSHYYLKRYHRAWFVKHNYLMSAALDSGTSVMVFLLAFAVQGAATGETALFPGWAGNVVTNDNPYANADYCCLDCP